MSDGPEGTTAGPIALIGVGSMGLPMGARLVGAGFAVRASDPDGSALAAAERRGLIPMPNPVAAVEGAGLVILMLPSTGVVRAVLGSNGLLETLAPGTLVVDMGSSEPIATQELAEELGRRAIRLIDAPVSGGVAGAAAGELTIMVGGDEQDVAAARPVLEHLGNPVHVGTVGSGDAAKALNNLLSATHLWVTSEAVLAGQRFGIEPETLLSVINGSSGRSGSTEAKWPCFVLPESYDSGFSMALMIKDMKIAVDLCQRVGQSVDLGSEAVACWEQAAPHLAPDADHTEVARWLRDTGTADLES